MKFGGGGDPIFRIARSLLDEDKDDFDSPLEGSRILEVSRTNATVDSSFPPTVVADSPPRTMTLSEVVVNEWPHRAVGPTPILLNENHRRAKL